jgi:hypothetical protein
MHFVEAVLMGHCGKGVLAWGVHHLLPLAPPSCRYFVLKFHNYITFVLKFPIEKRDLGTTLCEKKDLALGNGNTASLFGHVPF